MTTTIAESAAKELESLAVHMPNVSDSDARAFALRMYYIEVSNEMSPTDAQTNVSHMFLVCSRTIGRIWYVYSEGLQFFGCTFCDSSIRPSAL